MLREVRHRPVTCKCTDPCRKTTFLLEITLLHFLVGWWEEGHLCRTKQQLRRLTERFAALGAEEGLKPRARRSKVRGEET